MKLSNLFHAPAGRMSFVTGALHPLPWHGSTAAVVTSSRRERVSSTEMARVLFLRLERYIRTRDGGGWLIVSGVVSRGAA